MQWEGDLLCCSPSLWFSVICNEGRDNIGNGKGMCGLYKESKVG